MPPPCDVIAGAGDITLQRSGWHPEQAASTAQRVLPEPRVQLPARQGAESREADQEEKGDGRAWGLIVPCLPTTLTPAGVEKPQVQLFWGGSHVTTCKAVSALTNSWQCAAVIRQLFK